MTTKPEHKAEVISRLRDVGVSYDDAVSLRRIAMTLHRWHELECGDSNDYQSFGLVRGKKSRDEFTYDDDGAPYIESHPHHGDSRARYFPVPDRERGAKKRLARIIGAYPELAAFVQTDPRGAALYICAKADATAERYSHGVAVYR